MKRGYTKRWRKRWDKGYHRDPWLWLMMDYFIDFANWEKKEVYFPGVGTVKVLRGQHVFGVPSMSRFLGISQKRARNRLKILEKMNFLAIKRTTRFSIATIQNYDLYNPLDPEGGNQKGSRREQPGQAEGIQRATPNNYNKDKNYNNNYKSEAAKVLNYLNSVKGSSYEQDEFIIDRLKDGKSVDQCIQIIKNKAGDPYFQNNPRFLNPETLFKAKHWDRYLNDLPPGKTKLKKPTIQILTEAESILKSQGEDAFLNYCEIYNVSYNDRDIILNRL